MNERSGYIPQLGWRSCVLLVVAVVFAAIATAQASSPQRHATLPFVAPDGRHVVYTRDLDDHSAELIVVDARGAGERVVVHDTSGSAMGNWAARGREIAYTIGGGDTSTLYRAPVEGGAARAVVQVVGKSLRLSNDGTRIAYAAGAWTRNRIVVAASDGFGARAITDSTAGYFNIAWSPDDRRIASTRLDAERKLDVWVMGVDGKHARAVAQFPDSVGRAQWPTWSPDGKRLAIQVGRYFRDDHARDRADIWVVDLVSGKLTNLTPGDDAWLDETPSWSGDGRTIVFQSTRSGRFEVWRMNADGSDAVQLTR